MWRLASPGTLELSSGHLFPGMTFTAQSKGVSHLVSSDHMFLTPDRYSESGGRKNIYWVVCVCVCVCACVLVCSGGLEHTCYHLGMPGQGATAPPSLLWRAWPVCCGWGPSSGVRGLCAVAGVPAGPRDKDSQSQGLCHLSWQKKLQT